ncbi:unnamed protein product [Amoebophrya sp. A25]|nr:unnamed protein product [Amoebophrya sp. A25]|eukprot:GSA25T00005658001.1
MQMEGVRERRPPAGQRLFGSPPRSGSNSAEERATVVSQSPLQEPRSDSPSGKNGSKRASEQSPPIKLPYTGSLARHSAPPGDVQEDSPPRLLGSGEGVRSDKALLTSGGKLLGSKASVDMRRDARSKNSAVDDVAPLGSYTRMLCQPLFLTRDFFSNVLEYLELTPTLAFLHGMVFCAVLSVCVQDKIREKAHEEASMSFFAKSGFKQPLMPVSAYEETFQLLSFAKIVLRALCFTFALFRFVGVKTKEEKAATERESWLGYFISNSFTALWPASSRGVLAVFFFCISRGVVESAFFFVQYLEIVDQLPSNDDSSLVCEVFDGFRSVFLKSILILGLFVGHRYIQSENEPEEFESWSSYMAAFGSDVNVAPEGEVYDPNDIRHTHMMSTPDCCSLQGSFTRVHHTKQGARGNSKTTPAVHSEAASTHPAPSPEPLTSPEKLRQRRKPLALDIEGLKNGTNTASPSLVVVDRDKTTAQNKTVSGEGGEKKKKDETMNKGESKDAAFENKSGSNDTGTQTQPSSSTSTANGDYPGDQSLVESAPFFYEQPIMLSSPELGRINRTRSQSSSAQHQKQAASGGSMQVGGASSSTADLASMGRRRTLSDDVQNDSVCAGPDSQLYSHLNAGNMITSDGARTPSSGRGEGRSLRASAQASAESITASAMKYLSRKNSDAGDPRVGSIYAGEARSPTPEHLPTRPSPTRAGKNNATWHAGASKRESLESLFLPQPASGPHAGGIPQKSGSKKPSTSGNARLLQGPPSPKRSPTLSGVTQNPSPRSGSGYPRFPAHRFTSLEALPLASKNAASCEQGLSSSLLQFGGPSSPLSGTHFGNLLAVAGATGSLLTSSPSGGSNTIGGATDPRLMRHKPGLAGVAFGPGDAQPVPVSSSGPRPIRRILGNGGTLGSSNAAIHTHDVLMSGAGLDDTNYSSAQERSGDRNWFLLQPRKPWQPRQLWRKLRFCVFGLDPFSQQLNSYACYFAGFLVSCSVIECMGEVFVFQTVAQQTWLGRRLITGNWRHAVYMVLFYPLESAVLFSALYLLRRFVLGKAQDPDSHVARLVRDLSRGLICFGLILMSHRVCSGLLSFFITLECKHIENEINLFIEKWRSFTRKQRQQKYQRLADTVRVLDQKLFLILHFVFTEHITYILLDMVDARCALTRGRHLGLFVLRHVIGVCLACVALWHAGVVNYAIYEGIWSKVERERLHLRDDQVLYRRELKDWGSFLTHGSRWSRSVCIRLFFMRYALTSNVVMGLIVSLVLWPAIAKIILAIG